LCCSRQGRLALDNKGDLYGTTIQGGSGLGIVFKIDTLGNETVLHSFAGPPTGGPGADGAHPFAGLLMDKGKLYGTTVYGGTFGVGTVFEIDESGNETMLHNFANLPDGANPWFDGLIADKKGNLYGATFAGGVFAEGMVFILVQPRESNP
jgi:uncharacterized repeat protein (TIGR03803 family)